MSHQPTVDPKLDLVLERIVDVPVHLVWEAWTNPERLKKWFCPRPWMVSECEIDLRPGGAFNTTMRSPQGEEFPGLGCYLEVVPMQRLTFTSALSAGFRPTTESDMPFTAIITMEPHGKGTRYVATALHSTEAGRDKHKAMGFYEGWGAALDQLVELIQSQA